MQSEEMKLLGLKSKDRVTGFSGVITSISFDLFGCIQALVTPPIGKNDVRGESLWMDTNRLEIMSKIPVMKCRHCNPDTGSNDLPPQRKI